MWLEKIGDKKIAFANLESFKILKIYESLTLLLWDSEKARFYFWQKKTWQRARLILAYFLRILNYDVVVKLFILSHWFYSLLFFTKQIDYSAHKDYC